DSGSITFNLYPTYGSEIDSEYLKQDTRLNDFNILGALTLYNGTYGSLDARFFELAGDIITNYILKNEHTDNLIGFQGYEDEQTIMTPYEFLDKIKDFEKHYCNNPNFEE
ncbi:MAG: hypothetical protein GQ477_05545, partial [Nanohaloarchaea archaeon]|nr:hypothetical protein [Candidatus Nanohaloarchaea archaeon]